MATSLVALALELRLLERLVDELEERGHVPVRDSSCATCAALAELAAALEHHHARRSSPA